MILPWAVGHLGHHLAVTFREDEPGFPWGSFTTYWVSLTPSRRYDLNNGIEGEGREPEETGPG